MPAGDFCAFQQYCIIREKSMLLKIDLIVTPYLCSSTMSSLLHYCFPKEILNKLTENDLQGRRLHVLCSVYVVDQVVSGAGRDDADRDVGRRYVGVGVVLVDA